jgi:hypothetical protein
VRTADFCFGRQHDSCARLRKFDRDNRRETPEMIFLALQESNYEQARAHTSIAAEHRIAPLQWTDSDAEPTACLTNGRWLRKKFRCSADRNVRNRIVQVCEFHALKERLLWSQQVRSLALLMPLSPAQIGSLACRHASCRIALCAAAPVAICGAATIVVCLCFVCLC